ncbi:MAG: nucleoside triphosphate pyrophosphatase [Porticoccaceae bacterium]
MADTVDFVLASTSPRRRALLEQIGARFAVAAVAVDETPRPGEAPGDYVTRLARAKAGAGASAFPDLPVLAADTTVAVDGRPVGKPADEQQAVAMLMALSARSHSVHTAVAMVFGDRVELRHSHTRVRFRALDPDECRAYWHTGEPADKAGGYAIQGLGAVFVEAIEGSYSGVVGLPLALTWELLQLFAIPCWHVARANQ